jgi:glycosyltransferase involved in cell wall biosynthesis
MLPVSVFIITLNEEKNIRRVLNSIKEFDETIIVDSGSSDDTINIAKEFNTQVSHQDWLGFSKQKQHAMELCKNDWVLNLDADEEIPTELLEEIKTAIAEDHANSIRFMRNDFFLNKPYPLTCKLPSNVRLYRKSKAAFDKDCMVHESAKVAGKQITLKTPFLHYGYNQIEDLAAKQNDYSSLKALEKFNKGKKFSYLKLALIYPIEFIKKFIFQRYITFGWRGLILSLMNANYAFMKESKLYGLHKNK